ncbi:penicillin-binding protein [Spongiivirga sp. MCCC 1A20706]
MFLFAIAVAVKLVNIQLVEGGKYKELAQISNFKNDTITANRGNIYAADGSLLATSMPKYDIRIDVMTISQKNFSKHVKGLADSLSTMLGEPSDFYLKKLRIARQTKNRYLLITRGLGYADYMRIKSFPLFKLGAYKGGLIVEQRTIREHPIGKMAARTIGHDRKDEEGYYSRVGIEGAFREFLRGSEGYQLKQKIAKGQWKPIDNANEVEPKDGYDVVTTIDVNMQDIAHQSLLRQLEHYKADHGTVVVMETETGEVKAISNLGKAKKGGYYERLNYAIGESHEPGSTFKLMTMIAALEDRVIDTSDVVDTGNGRYKFYDRTVRDSKWGGFGKVSMAQAFELSSNVAFARIIDEKYKQKPERFVNRLYNMGLNDKLGLPILGEGNPSIPHPTDKYWSGTSLPWMTHGYGVSMTALQTLTFYNAIANDGKMVKPRFVKEIRAWNKSYKSYKTEVIDASICSKETALKAKEMMKNVVRRGTAKNIYSPDFSMAGKTGTCQYNYWIESGRYISSFAGYFPADNPKYSCIVVIHQPDKEIGYYGADVAAPVFKEIAMKIYTDTPFINEVENLVVENVLADPDYQTYFTKAQNDQAIMPNVKGMVVMDAVALLENMGLQVSFSGTGKIKEQSIKPGVEIKGIKKVTIKS